MFTQKIRDCDLPARSATEETGRKSVYGSLTATFSQVSLHYQPYKCCIISPPFQVAQLKLSPRNRCNRDDDPLKLSRQDSSSLIFFFCRFNKTKDSSESFIKQEGKSAELLTYTTWGCDSERPNAASIPGAIGSDTRSRIWICEIFNVLKWVTSLDRKKKKEKKTPDMNYVATTVTATKKIGEGGGFKEMRGLIERGNSCEVALLSISDTHLAFIPIKVTLATHTHTHMLGSLHLWVTTSDQTNKNSKKNKYSSMRGRRQYKQRLRHFFLFTVLRPNCQWQVYLGRGRGGIMEDMIVETWCGSIACQPQTITAFCCHLNRPATVPGCNDKAVEATGFCMWKLRLAEHICPGLKWGGKKKMILEQ